MPREFSRIDRIGDQMQRELAQLIQREVKDPRVGMVTVNAVKVSRDLGYADVYVSLLTTEELTEESPQVRDSLTVLNKAAGFLKGQVGRAMKLRVTPQLRFHFDTLLGHSRHMDNLIREAVGDKPVVDRDDDARNDGASDDPEQKGLSRRRKGRDVNGILVIDKPMDITSNGILQQVKRLFGAAKAGHTGALDPLATGVLPLCFGEATKFSQMMLDSDKAYIATARLGVRTETGDSEGAVVAEKPVPPGLDADALEPVLERFRGDIQQVPSMYSALKHKGKPLYEYAREGIEVERPSRPVTIYELTLLEVRETEIDIAVSCTKGTYIRSLVEDIGEALGCGAHVTALRRTMASGFTLADAREVPMLESMREEGESLDGLLVAPDAALSMFPERDLEGSSLVSILNGQPVRISGQPAEGFVRLYGNGRFVGLAEGFPEGEATKLVPRRLVKSG